MPCFVQLLRLLLCICTSLRVPAASSSSRLSCSSCQRMEQQAFLQHHHQMPEQLEQMSMMLRQQQILQAVRLEEEQHLQRTCWLDIGELLFHV
jgi:hypothetical protein